MVTSFWNTLILLGALLFQNASAQQYLGDVIPNATYPSIPGSELAYFRVKDPAGKNNNLTLVNYLSLGSTGKRLVPANVKRAVIIIHGLNRDPGTYMSNMLVALSQVNTDSNINFDSVAIIAPSFPNGDDKNVTYPYWDYPPGAKKKASGGAQSWTNALVWKGSQWAGGGTNQYPVKSTTISSYDVLDQLIQYYADKSNFPNINQIVIAGHSLGGQTVQRYAAVGKPLSSLGVTVPVTYWIANPNSLVWLNSSRPLSTADCADYDEWRDGLSAYADYPSIYNTDLVASGSSAVIANYETKNKAYARGILDMGDDSTGCAPFTTGGNRHERFYYFINWWTPTCEAQNSTTGHCDTVDLISMGHDGGGMMASPAGQARLFTDNFYGDGTRSYDFGYPRIQSDVDDPYPNPAYNESSTAEDTTVYAGNMTFAGCYTDSSTRTLAYMAYDSTSNTVDECTAACVDAGYTIAGMEYGSQCWCDKALGPDAEKTLDVGCSMACAGNSSQTCGNGNRLSVYSNGVPVQNSAPSNPEDVGNYFFSGCHTEATSGRALSGTSYSDGTNMTLETCAAFCNGYKYFGVEYASQCYCGSYFGAGSAVASDSSCSMVCSGNALEICGGPNALSVYELDSDAPVSTIVQGSTTTSPVATSTGASVSIPSASLCPATNGQVIADSNNITYTISCSSDTNVGSYSNAQAVNSYLDCMVACDSASSTGCVAWTYQGGANGQGSGTCYLKNSQGSFISGSSSLVSGFKSSSSASSSTIIITTSTSSASSAAATYTNGSTPTVAGVTFLTETDTTYAGTTMTLSRKRASTVVGDCLRVCASSSICVATAFDGDSSTCTYYSDFDKSSKSVDVGTTFATVQNRASATTTSSSSTGIPSASLCPATDGQTISGYVVSCSSDTSIGSYSNQQAANSYLECMSACDSAASTGCQAWTYVGGTNGLGSGTCWLKNSKGSFTAAGTNYIAGMIVSQASSSLSSSQSGSPTSSTALSGSVSSTSSVSSATASSSVCPGIDSQDMTDSNGNVFTIRCSADTTVGAFSNTQVSNSYAECMVSCDSTKGCVAFTYVGGTNGVGSGTCWLKNDRGSASAAGNNYVAGFLKSIVASSSSSTSSSATTSSSTILSSTASASSGVPTASLCPTVNGQIVTDSKGNQYNVTCSADNTVGSWTNTQASTSYLDCMTACDATTGCQGFTYVGGAYGSGSGTCWLKQSMADYPAAANNVISAVKVAKSNANVALASSLSSVLSSSSSLSTSSVASTSSSLSSSSVLTTSSNSASSSTMSSSSALSSSGILSSSISISTSSVSSSSTTSSSSTLSSSSSMPSSSVTSTSSAVSSSSLLSSSSALSSSTQSVSLTQSSSFGSSIVSSTTSQSSSSQATTFSTSSTSSASATSTALLLPTGFSSYGCFIDGSPRVLAYSAGSTSANTPLKCASTCQSLGYKYAGTEYGSECWCSNTTPTSSTKATDCNMPCSGDNTQTCGAGNRLSVYVDNTWTQKFNARSKYGSWNLVACYTDGTNGRVLPQTMAMTGGSSNATIANCLDACAKSGLRVCGAEYYQECYGSSALPSSSLVAGSDPLTAGCNYPCTGNSTEACGGSNRILVYINNGTSATRH